MEIATVQHKKINVWNHVEMVQWILSQVISKCKDRFHFD